VKIAEAEDPGSVNDAERSPVEIELIPTSPNPGGRSPSGFIMIEICAKRCAAAQL
jgi:hypothetical protein